MFFKKEEYINKHSIFMQTDSKYFRKITKKLATGNYISSRSLLTLCTMKKTFRG